MCKVGRTGGRRSDVPGFVGMDVAKAPWDIALRPSGERWAVPNDVSGVTRLVDRVQALKPPLMVREATGGLERAVTSALAAAGFPGVVGNPRQVRDGARATGPLAKTEALDARALAHVADVIRPPPRPLPAAPPQALRALLGRRQPLRVLRTAAQHRLAGTRARLAKESAAPIPWRNADSATLDHDLATIRRASPLGRDKDAVLQSTKGLGPVSAHPVRLARPEWGTLTRQHIAALVGVAPLPGDRGTFRGRRPIWGGRAQVRTVCYLAPRVATRYNP